MMIVGFKVLGIKLQDDNVSISRYLLQRLLLDA